MDSRVVIYIGRVFVLLEQKDTTNLKMQMTGVAPKFIIIMSVARTRILLPRLETLLVTVLHTHELDIAIHRIISRSDIILLCT